MIKNLLEKMKSIFKDDDEIQEHTQPTTQRQEIKARMTYQYPEKKFRFPVIPDHVDVPEKDKQSPAYVRRKRRETPVSPQTPQKEIKKTKSTEPHTRKVIRDENAPPFEVSKVPSPVYGFQKQKNKETDHDIPTFVRKREEQLKKEEESKIIEALELKEEVNIEEDKVIEEIMAEDEIVLQAETEHIEEIQEEISSTNLGEAEVASSLEIPEQEEEPVLEARQAPKEDIKTIQQLAKEEMENESTPKKHEQRPSKRSKKRESKNNSAKVPFNVIMTPLDRARYQQKQASRQQFAERPIERPKHETAQNSEENMDSKQHAIQRIGEQEEPTPKNTTENAVAIERPKDIQIPIHLLNDPEVEDFTHEHWIDEQQNLLEQTLKHFHVAAKVVKATQGPTVTRFEVQPELGVKVSKIRNLSDDLKLNMAAKDIRIEAPIPGKNTVGIEVPNPHPQMVGFQEIVDTEEFKKNPSPLAIGLGLTIEGEPKITNIQKMPHGLIAGATGSGKSVCINTILISILYKASHEDVKFLMIDPKMVELAPYNGIPHLVSPVITDVKAATQSLKWAVQEMEDRYERFVEEGVRDIERYNRKVLSDGRTDRKMPYIVIVIDELADLMMMSPQDVESAISRIAQKARACGIHLLLATQRPSVDVITGLIKANIPTRIAFSVSSQVDSRTILDASGAEKLLGRGDMLFMENGTGKSVRLQGPFVSDDEIERVTAYVRQIAEPEYLFEQEQLLEQIEFEEDEDELLEEAIQFVIRQQSASTSMLQRHFKVGYNRAARLIDTMEARGIISGQNGSKPRDVLVNEITVE